MTPRAFSRLYGVAILLVWCAALSRAQTSGNTCTPTGAYPTGTYLFPVNALSSGVNPTTYTNQGSNVPIFRTFAVQSACDCCSRCASAGCLTWWYYDPTTYHSQSTSTTLSHSTTGQWITSSGSTTSPNGVNAGFLTGDNCMLKLANTGLASQFVPAGVQMYTVNDGGGCVQSDANNRLALLVVWPTFGGAIVLAVIIGCCWCRGQPETFYYLKVGKKMDYVTGWCVGAICPYGCLCVLGCCNSARLRVGYGYGIASLLFSIGLAFGIIASIIPSRADDGNIVIVFTAIGSIFLLLTPIFCLASILFCRRVRATERFHNAGESGDAAPRKTKTREDKRSKLEMPMCTVREFLTNEGIPSEKVRSELKWEHLDKLTQQDLQEHFGIIKGKIVFDKIPRVPDYAKRDGDVL